LQAITFRFQLVENVFDVHKYGAKSNRTDLTLGLEKERSTVHAKATGVKLTISATTDLFPGRTMKRTLLIIGTLSLIAWPALADDQHHHEGLSPQQVGAVHLATSCNKAVQSQFDIGVAMLHSFWYEESEKAFRAVAVKDPHCAMAQWGVAMSRYHQLWGEPLSVQDMQIAQSALARAEKLAAKTTPREREYIAAMSAFYATASVQQTLLSRADAYSNAMAVLHEHNPDDREAAVFYALSLLALIQPTDKTYSLQKKAGAILNQVLAEQPNHPGVTHYLIHSCDYPSLAPMALNAARNYARIAPTVPHAQHMPSHIFTRLGLWDESITSNLAAESAALAYAAKTHMNGTWDEQLHAMDYLMYAYLQRGDTQRARQVLEQDLKIVKPNADTLKAAYPLATIPARFVVERGDWAAAARLPVRPSQYAATEAITRTARALGSARTGDIAGAATELAKIEQLRNRLTAENDLYWSAQVEIQRREGVAWIAYASGKHEDGLALMRSAVDLENSTDKINLTHGPLIPSQELLGDMLLAEKQPAPALAAYESSLAMAPNRLYALQHAVHAAELAGDEAKAAGYRKVIAVTAPASATAPASREPVARKSH
jgi:tetratricopeptide (TPR) repeat protein